MSSAIRAQVLGDELAGGIAADSHDHSVCPCVQPDPDNGPDADRLTARIAAELRGLHAYPSPSPPAR